MKRSRAKTTFALGSLAVIAVAVFVLWPRGPALRVLDPRMRVISARLLTGTNEHFYAGNQLDGRARDFLKRIGLHIETLPDVGKQPERFMGPTETCRFAIFFKWTGASDPAFVTAELVEISRSAITAESSGVDTAGAAGAPIFVTVDHSGHIMHEVPYKFGQVPTDDALLSLRRRTESGKNEPTRLPAAVSVRARPKRPFGFAQHRVAKQLSRGNRDQADSD
jgi:hypothetical protein